MHITLRAGDWPAAGSLARAQRYAIRGKECRGLTVPWKGSNNSEAAKNLAAANAKNPDHRCTHVAVLLARGGEVQTVLGRGGGVGRTGWLPRPRVQRPRWQARRSGTAGHATALVRSG